MATTAEAQEFFHRVHDQRRDLARQHQSLRAQQGGIERKIAEIEQRLKDLDRAEVVYRDVMGLEKEKAAPTAELFEGVPMGTIADMAYAILQRHDKPMKVAELTKVLENMGKLDRSKDASGRGNYGTVYGTITRDARFVKTAQGEFGLSEAQAAEKTEQILAAERLAAQEVHITHI